MYRGTRDSFKSKAFCEKCGDNGDTLTIIKTKEFNQIIGGYTNIPWSKNPSKNCQMKGTHKSFLFKLDDNKKIIKLYHQ